MEQSDIIPVLKEFQFQNSEDGLVVMNPPLVKFDEEFNERYSDVESDDTE